MSKLIVSKQQIIPIEEFMEKYVGKIYDGQEKLTHHVMEMYLYEKGLAQVEKVSFDKVNNENLLNGTYIVVKDNRGQRIVYRNPRSSFKSLEEELRTLENLKKTRQARYLFLKEQNYSVAQNGVVNKEEIVEQEYMIEKPNRQKILVKGYRKGYQRSHY